MTTIAPYTVAWDHVGPLIVMHMSPANPSKKEWDYMVAEALPRTRVGRIRGVLVRTDGGGPNSLQRKQIVELESASPHPSVPMAILVSSAITRGIVTALSWVGLNTKAFAPQKMAEALVYLAQHNCGSDLTVETAKDHLDRLAKELTDR